MGIDFFDDIIYILCMDIFELNELHDEGEDVIEGEVIDNNGDNNSKAVSINNGVNVIDKDKEMIKKAVEEEARVRRLEIASWAESKGIVKGVPTVEELETVWIRLQAGKTIKEAIKKICCYATWCKWRKEIPEVAMIEEEARYLYTQRIEEETKKIASQADRTKMGEVGRDRLWVETNFKLLERQDRLTENRMKNESSAISLTPIQINVEYGK